MSEQATPRGTEHDSGQGIGVDRAGVDRAGVDRAERFGALHVPGQPLLLANAWDVASAVIVEQAGAAAVATTSAGVAWSLGMPDGDRLGRDDAVAVVARIAPAIGVPLSADIESGFGADADGVAETIRGVIGAGAVGVNIEDALSGGSSPLRPLEEQVERIAAARRAADELGVPLYINARTDVFLRSVGEPANRLQAALERAAAFLAAGASGVFVPGVTRLDTVATLTKEIAAPVNILVKPGAPSVAELADVGVARVSYGSAGALAAYGVLRHSVEELLGEGTYVAVADALDYGELNAALAARVVRP